VSEAAAVAGRLRGLRVLVTGSGSGIGRATCLRLAAEGARVLATDRDAGLAAETTEQIDGRGGDAVAAALDVSSSDIEGRLPELVDEHLGGLDGLVNNAGIGTPGSLLETSDEDWRHLFAVNVEGMFHCTRATLPGMLKQGKGSVVNMASVAGLVGLTNRFAYCATKGAVVSMTRASALDFAGSGVRFNCVCPGTIETPWVESMAASSAGDREDFYAQMRARQPLGRMGRSEEVAAAVAYLCSSDSEFVTGSAMVVDGGLTAGVPASRR
jgi:meso-butanediol dehydrogenase / (S,S)-butanediol dehydrogenase / diacetyl reductase